MPIGTLYSRIARNGPSSGTEWLLSLTLIPLGLLYGRLMVFRAFLYRVGLFPSYRSVLPVVSVGNLTVGGTGKTPMVDYLVRWFVARGMKVAVVSRGYGAEAGKSPSLVSTGDARLLLSAEECGDEPVLLASRNPESTVIVARQRRLGVKLAEDRGAQVIILDDGFQHLAVARDLNLLLLDSRCPFGNGLPLPAGLLREPVTAGRRADVMVWTHAENPAKPLPGFKQPYVSCRHLLADYVLDRNGDRLPLHELSGKRIVAFAGIADPAGFFKALKSRGLELAAEIALADHQGYTREVISSLERVAETADLLLTTEKDAVKLKEAPLSRPCYCIPMTLEFDDPTPLEEALQQLVTKE